MLFCADAAEQLLALILSNLAICLPEKLFIGIGGLMARYAVLMILLCALVMSCKGHTKESLNSEGLTLLKKGN